MESLEEVQAGILPESKDIFLTCSIICVFILKVTLWSRRGSTGSIIKIAFQKTSKKERGKQGKKCDHGSLQEHLEATIGPCLYTIV